MAHESGGDKSRRSTLDKCWRVSRFSRKKEKKHQAHCKHLHPIKCSEAGETVTIVFILITPITS